MKGAIMGLLQGGFLLLALILVLLPPSFLAQRRSKTRLQKPLSLRQQFEVKETLRLLSEGDSLPVDKMGHEDFVLVIGNTGAGKTTITKFLAQTHLLESYNAIDRFLITDKHGKISKNSTIVSKTIFPDLIIDKETDTAFYDLPGFQDTRNASVEIANACFIKKVADRASRVKLLFVLNYSSVKSGESRTDFKTLLEQAVDLVKEPAHFANSTALVLTKVESSKTNEEIMAGIQSFLRMARRDLPNIFPDEEKMNRAYDLINNFLQEDEDGNLLRIAFFKQPTKLGLLSSMPEMMEQKERIYRVIMNTDYTTKYEDFGISISSSAQFLTSRIVYDLKGKIKSAVNGTSLLMQDFFTNAVQTTGQTEVGRVYGLHREVTEALDGLSPDLQRTDFFDALSSVFSPLKLNLDPLVTEMRNREENLAFFEGMQSSPLTSAVPEWISLLKDGIHAAKSRVETLGVFLNTMVFREMNNLGEQLESVLTAMANSTTDMEDLQQLNIMSAALLSNTSGLIGSETFNEFVRHLKAFFPRPGEEDLNTQLTDNYSILNSTTGPDELEFDGFNFNLTSEALADQDSNDTFLDMDERNLNRASSLEVNLPATTTGPTSSTPIPTTTTTTTPIPPAAIVTYNYTLQEMTLDMNLKDSPGYSSPFRVFNWIRPLEKASARLLRLQGSVEGRIKDEQHRQTELRYMRALEKIQQTNNQTLQAEREAREQTERSLRLQKETLDKELELQREAFGRDLHNQTEEMHRRLEEAEKEKRRKEEVLDEKIKAQRSEFQQLEESLQKKTRVLNEQLERTRMANSRRSRDDEQRANQTDQTYKDLLDALRRETELIRRDMEAANVPECRFFLFVCWWRV